MHDLARERIKLRLLSSEAEFVYRPMEIGSRSARGARTRLLSDISPDVDAELLRGELAEVEAVAVARTPQRGGRLSYDGLEHRLKPSIARDRGWSDPRTVLAGRHVLEAPGCDHRRPPLMTIPWPRRRHGLGRGWCRGGGGGRRGGAVPESAAWTRGSSRESASTSGRGRSTKSVARRSRRSFSAD